MDLYKKQKIQITLYENEACHVTCHSTTKGNGGDYVSLERIALGKEAIEKLKIAQSHVVEAYEILIESGLLPRNAKSICKNYINDSLEDKKT